MSPTLAQLSLSKNIEIITKAQVIECSQGEENFHIRIRQKPRYVDPARCVSCGLCEKKCPVYVTLSPFHDKTRSAIYLPSNNGIPRGYVIDENECLFVKEGSCRICERVCPKGAINLDQNPKEMEIECSGVVLAQGLTPYIPKELSRFGYGILKNVVTNIEFENLLNPAGITKGKIKRPSDGREPESIAWIQCIGSRQTNIVKRPYCSGICCSAAIKQAITAKHILGRELKADIYYIDIRTYQKGAERYFIQAHEKGVNFVNSRPFGVCLSEDDKIAIKFFSTQTKDKTLAAYDMVVLSTGLFIDKEIERLSWQFGIETDEFGFNKSIFPEVEKTSRSRLFACGNFNGPKSITGAVIEGSAAAAFFRRGLSDLKALKSPKFNTDTDKKSQKIPIFPARIGLFICRCGQNISDIIDTKQLLDHFSHAQKEVVFCSTLPFSCAPDGVKAISQAIKDHSLNRIVISACSPRSHEIIFRKALEKAGLDPSMLVIANIREQSAWVHQNDKNGAFERAKDQISMAIHKALQLSPFKKREYPVTRAVLVLGGGISGMTAASIIAESGIKVHLVEKEGALGGNARSLLETWRGISVKNLLNNLEKRIRNNPLISIYLNSSIERLQGITGNLTSYLKTKKLSSYEQINHGALILATGAREAKPSGFHYREHPGILTHQDFDRMLMASGTERLRSAKTVVFLQCVESCNKERPYCSRVCCTHAVTRAVHLKKHLPELEIYIVYKHMRTYGQRDEYFRKARQMGIKALRFNGDNPPRPEIFTDINENLKPIRRLRLRFVNILLDSEVVLHPDFIILATAIEPDMENNQKLSAIFKLPLGQDGFFQELHPKLRPCELRRDGFFMAGLAHYPKEVEESTSQAAAAASKAIAFLSQDRIVPDRNTAKIVAHMCDGCGLCLEVCKEKAISLCEFIFRGETKQMAEIDDSICNGCGACEAVCPKYAVGIPGFMPQEVEAQIKAILRS